MYQATRSMRVCTYECAYTRETEHNAPLNLDQQRTQQATKSDWALTTFLPVRKCVQCRLKIQLSVELTWTLLRGKRESIGPCVVAAFRSTRVWATLILPCNRSKNCVWFHDDKVFIRAITWYCSYLQQNQHFVHELQTLLRIAEYEDGEAIFRAIGAENKRYISNIKL